MKTIVRLIALSLHLTAVAGPADVPASVTLPIQEYLQLKQNAEAPSLKMLEQATLSGHFGKKLTVEFSGASPKKWDKKVIADASEQFSFSGCRGQAYLDRDGDQVVIVPKAEAFKLTCDLEVSNWASLEIILRNVLALKSNVTGAQIIIQKVDEGSKRITFVTENASRRNVAADVSSLGRYRLTKLPDGIRFNYHFIFNNPGRTIRSFNLTLPNGEELQKISSDQLYTERAGGVTLSLKPGDTELILEGKYTRTEFSPLLESQQQYLLLESHPSLQVEVTSSAKRISIADSGLSASFRNATAYLCGKSAKTSWTSRELELIASVGFSVESASYVYYVPEAGHTVVEASFFILNQGTPEIPLKIDGKPTYVEVDGVGEPLYSDSKGNLLLRLPTGQHNVLVQYQAPHVARGLSTQFTVPLVRPETVLSNVQLSLGTPEKWRLLYGVSLFHPESDLSVALFFSAMVAFILMFGLATAAKVQRLSRWLIGLSSAAVAFLKPELLPLLLLAAAVSVTVRHRKALWRWLTTRSRLMLGLGLGGLTVILGVGIVASLAFRIGTSNHPANYQSSRSAPVVNSKSSAPAKKDLEDELDGNSQEFDEPSPEESSGGGYVGMPARIKLPYPARQVAFHQQLVDKNTPLFAQALFISTSVFEWVALGCALLGLASFYRERKKVRDWLRV